MLGVSRGNGEGIFHREKRWLGWEEVDGTRGTSSVYASLDVCVRACACLILSLSRLVLFNFSETSSNAPRPASWTARTNPSLE